MYCEAWIFIFAFNFRSDDSVNLGKRWLLCFQVIQEPSDLIFVAFQKDFYACVASVSDISIQFVLDGNTVDERTEAYALYDARDSYFNPHGSHLCGLELVWGFIYILTRYVSP